MSTAKEAFDSLAKDYDAWFESPEGKVLFEMEVEAVRRLMEGLKKPFLEVGVGTGRFARALGIEFGIDPSLNMVEIATKRGIKVSQAEGEKVPFKDESFGGVFVLFTLCFVEDPAMVLSEAKRVLKRGGGLIVGIINRESPWGELYLKKKAEGHPIYKHARFYAVDEAAAMIENAGLVVEAFSSTLNPPPSDMPYKEEAQSGIGKGAGFVCILAVKP